MYDADTYAGGDNANDRETTFQIKSTKLYVPVFTLSTKDNENLPKQFDEGFKRSVYWNEYKSKIETKNFDNKNFLKCKIILLLIMAMMDLIKLKETAIENISSQE